MNTQSSPEKKMSPSSLSPIRIYVLWHPGFDNPAEFEGRAMEPLNEKEKARLDRGLKLARRIFYWFRMENMEGIPVYFRSHPEKQGGIVPPPIRLQSGLRNYVIPLVDANMVSSPEWRQYVADLAVKDDDVSSRLADVTDTGEPEYRVLPVAMEPVAYNMPECMRKLNFIRHVPAGDEELDDMVLLAKLTEVLCRDLRFWLQRKARRLKPVSTGAIPRKIKIFLSHAKADDTDEPVAIKEYIQRETQCEAFFDETDIASGYDYQRVLEDAVGGESAGLIVIQGDNYADRPWCRKEIRDFLNPVRDRLAKGDHIQFFIPPVVVVQTMKGKQIGRTIAELGYSPCVRWYANAARLVVTTLLREILFGLFYRILACQIAELDSFDQTASRGEAGVYVNRAPDPVMINRILKQIDGKHTIKEIIHPGYGLSKMEKEGLESSVHSIRFSSFLERSEQSEQTGRSKQSKRSSPSPSIGASLTGKIIAVSAGNAEDILSRGTGDEHTQELLVRLFRPLLSRQASLLYGGAMPESIRPAAPWKERVNFMGALINLLVTERDTHGAEAADRAPRLYVPVPWHERSKITVKLMAQWTDICSFITITDKDSGFDGSDLPVIPKPLTDADFEGLTDRAKRDLKEKRKRLGDELAAIDLVVKARCLSAMRKKICDSHNPLRCKLPDAPVGSTPVVRDIKTFAHILIGGKTSSFTGMMPGVFEEVLCAFEQRKPVFIISAGGGAAALLAKWLAACAQGESSRQDSPPREFTTNHYSDNTRYKAFLGGLKTEAAGKLKMGDPAKALADLWRHISKVNSVKSLSARLENGLTGNENVELLTTDSSQRICHLVWKGIEMLASKESRTDHGPLGKRSNPA
jgi:SLOG cluster2/TIR domain